MTIIFNEIGEPDQLYRWFSEHSEGDVDVRAIAQRYIEYITTIDKELGDNYNKSFVQFGDGEITSEGGQKFETNILSRTFDKMKVYRIVFVMDANDQIMDVVYMGPEDPRMKPDATGVH